MTHVNVWVKECQSESALKRVSFVQVCASERVGVRECAQGRV